MFPRRSFGPCAPCTGTRTDADAKGRPESNDMGASQVGFGFGGLQYRTGKGVLYSCCGLYLSIEPIETAQRARQRKSLMCGFANLPCRIRKSNTAFSGEVKALLRACDGAQTHTHTYIYAYAHAHALTVDARGVYLASQRVTLTIVARSLRFPGRFFHFS